MESEFATFEPLPLSPSEILKKNLEEKDKEQQRVNLLNALGDIEELKSNYLGMSSFYYSRKANKIYEYDNSKHQLLKPNSEVEARIRQLNNL
jgi:hypothetical protein